MTSPDRGARPQLIRTLNEQLLLEEVRRQGRTSRAELARATGLSKPTVALALTSLEGAGLVQHAGMRSAARGRAASLYEIRSDAGFVLGLDVGREYIRGALADLSGAVRAGESVRSRSSSGRGRVGEVTRLADDLLARGDVRRSDAVVHTVVGSPGVLDPSREALRMAANLPGWERPSVLAALRSAFGTTAAIENDVDAAAVAERDHGHGRAVPTFAFVSIGTGIGMGLVIDGKLHRGAHGVAGEIAFLPLAGEDATPAEVRRRGSLETAASSSAVVRAAREAGMRDPSSARAVFAAADEGDELARAVVAREVEHVARALASIVAVVDPELIVLGGGIGRAPGFAEAVAAALARLAPVVPDVRASALGDDVVVVGCIACGMEQLWQRVLESRGLDQRY